jgi:PAS domain S-box-containing protein
MARKPRPSKSAPAEVTELRARLYELEETLRAIRSGQVDALVVYAPAGGDRIFTLQGAEHPYRVLVEAMNEGAATMTTDGLVLFANQHFARMLDIPLERLIGTPLSEVVRPVDYASLDALLQKVQEGPQKVESVWHVGKEKQKLLPVSLSLSPVREGNFEGVCVIATDLTEQRHREQELAQTNAALIDEVAKRMRVEDELRRDEESLRQLSGRLLQLQDEERRRIARDLHDSTGQKLVALSLDLTVLNAFVPELPPKASAAVNECQVLAEQISSEIRTLSYLLHPPLLDEVGLASAVQWYIDGFTRRSNIRVNLDFAPQVPRMKHELEITFFRILQEALTNVHRHSGSKVATVRFGLNDDGVTLEVEDSGRRLDRTSLVPSGEPVGTLGVGIRGMQERVRQLGGQFEVNSNTGGTTIRATLPTGAQAFETPPGQTA